MNKLENYLGIANHDIQMANNSQELKSYVASILCENDELQQENQKYKEVIDRLEKKIKLVKQYDFDKMLFLALILFLLYQLFLCIFGFLVVIHRFHIIY